jgi:hypothetical protein
MLSGGSRPLSLLSAQVRAGKVPRQIIDDLSGNE